MLGVAELNENEKSLQDTLAERLLEIITRLNRTDKLNTWLELMGLTDLLQPDTSYRPYKNAKIVIIGEAQIKENIISAIIKKSDINKWFNSLKEETDLYYMALLTLSLFSNKKKYSNISELPIILDRNSFLNLITIYGGKTITIPTKEEILGYVQSLYYVYSSEVENIPQKKILENLKIDSDTFKTLPINQVKKLIQNILPVSREDV